MFSFRCKHMLKLEQLMFKSDEFHNIEMLVEKKPNTKKKF